MLTLQNLDQELSFEREAIVEKDILPNDTGRVKFQGSYWPARCQQSNITLTQGQRCYVVDIHNITLLVDVQLSV